MVLAERGSLWYVETLDSRVYGVTAALWCYVERSHCDVLRLSALRLQVSCLQLKQPRGCAIIMPTCEASLVRIGTFVAGGEAL